MINPALARQLATLLAQANATTVPSGLLAWWGSVPLPDGSGAGGALSLGQWTAVMNALRQAELVPALVLPLPAIDAMTAAIRPDGPLPVAMTRYRVSKPTAAFMAAVNAVAVAGGALPEPLPALADVLETQEVFATAAPMHAQWGRATPTFRSRLATWSFDQRFFVTSPGAPLPERIDFDAGDGVGFRRVQFGDVLASAHPTGETIRYAVRAQWGATTLEARGIVALGGSPTPLPDETWTLSVPGGLGGTAYVFRAPDHADVVRPVIIAEGFPGGFPCDYLYEMINQGELLESLRAAGHDVILLGFDNGTALMEDNAPVVMACLQQVHARTSHPAAVGGVSMGGLITRYALAWLEQHGLEHHAHLFFTIDTPHRGSVTAVAVQWFTHYFRKAIPMARDFSALIGTDANREFLLAFLTGNTIGVDPKRTSFLRKLAALGEYPQHVRRIAVSCGHGNGGASLPPGAPLLSWTGSPWVGVQLNASAGGSAPALVAQGECLLAPDVPSATLRMTSARSWEGAPGGLNEYTPLAAQIASLMGCGTVQVQAPTACVVPTISALDIDQDPFAPIPAPSTGRSPFHDYTCSATDVVHCTLTPPVAQWLLERLTAPPSPAPISP